MTPPEQLMNNDSLHLPIYMDYSATTPIDPRVVDKMIPYLREQFGNPASRSHAYGWSAERAVEEAREQVAALVNADPREIIWTSGATESDNLALKGAAHFYKSKGKHIITVKTEHKAVLDTTRELEREGFEVTYLDVKDDGLIDLDAFKAALRADTILVSVMSVNNEIGVIQDIEAIGDITREKGIIFHVDAAQATGKIQIDLQKLKVDLMSFSAHKTYGPKGIGALYVRRKPRIRIEAQMHGGGHERGMRSGTLATHQIVGMGEAFRIAREEMATENERIRMLRDRLLMAVKDVAVSSGSACTSASLEPSYVLRALGRNDELAHSSIRFTVGRFTTEQEIDYVINLLKSKISKLRDLSPLWEMHKDGIDLSTIQWAAH
jgi:cysteine desulfurase